MLYLLLISVAVCSASNVYTEPAIFERLSHFADHGVPGTTKDPLNQASRFILFHLYITH